MTDKSYVDQGLCDFDGEKWVTDQKVREVFREDKPGTAPLFHRLLDVDGDGVCEMIARDGKVYRHEAGKDWQPLPFVLPCGIVAGLRFVDLNGDGKLDVVFSNEKEFGVYLFSDRSEEH